MRAVWQAVCVAVALALAEHDAICQSCRTRGDVHGGATGEVEPAELVDPAGGVPGPAGDGVVDDRGPDEDEYDAREHAAAVGSGSDGYGGAGEGLLADYRETGREKHVRDGCEHSLVDSVQQIWDLWTAHTRLCEDIVEAEVREVAQEGARGVRERKGIAPEEPLERDHAYGHHR